MEKFKETKNIAKYQGGVEIELHKRYGDLEPYDLNEAETYYTGHKIYICRCVDCGRVINASRENLLYGNMVHCGCIGEKINRGYYELDQLDNFDYLQLDIERTGNSSDIKIPYKPVTNKQIKKWKEESKKMKSSESTIEIEKEDGTIIIVNPDNFKQK